MQTASVVDDTKPMFLFFQKTFLSFGSYVFHILKYFGTSISTVRLNFIMEKAVVPMEAITSSPRQLTSFPVLQSVSEGKHERALPAN